MSHIMFGLGSTFWVNFLKHPNFGNIPYSIFSYYKLKIKQLLQLDVIISSNEFYQNFNKHPGHTHVKIICIPKSDHISSSKKIVFYLSTVHFTTRPNNQGDLHKVDGSAQAGDGAAGAGEHSSGGWGWEDGTALVEMQEMGCPYSLQTLRKVMYNTALKYWWLMTPQINNPQLPYCNIGDQTSLFRGSIFIMFNFIIIMKKTKW